MKFKRLLIKQLLIKKINQNEFTDSRTQKNNIKIVSKKSIIILGLALIASANVYFTTNVNSFSISK
jgi:hypothetical protein